MAFIKLFPPEQGPAFDVAELLRRLSAEFDYIHADSEAGRSHVADMIAATLRFSDALPHKQQQLADLRSVHDAAVYVTFGDSEESVASCCLLPERPLFFDGPDEIDGPARPLVERCAKILGYELYEG